MMDGDDNFAGLVVMGVRLTYFRKLLSDLELAPNRSMMLLRTDGTLLLRLPFDLDTVADSFGAGTPLDTALRAGKTSVVASDSVDQVERRFVLRHVGSLPLAVCAGTSTGGILASTVSWWLLAFGCCIALVALSIWRRLLPRSDSGVHIQTSFSRAQGLGPPALRRAH